MALTQRRYGAEMREWFALFEKTVALLRATEQSKPAFMIEALRDLLFESIQFGEHESIEEVLRRAHVRTILRALSVGAATRRSALAEATSLRDANLSRVLYLLQSAGLIEREQLGKDAFFYLTFRGEQARKSIKSPKHSPLPDPVKSQGDGLIQRGVGRVTEVDVDALAKARKRTRMQKKPSHHRSVVTTAKAHDGAMNKVTRRSSATSDPRLKTHGLSRRARSQTEPA